MSTKKKNYDSYFKDIEKFYKIKSDYEHKYKKEKDKIMGNTNYKTMEEKREKLSKFKSKCVGCKKKRQTFLLSLVAIKKPRVL